MTYEYNGYKITNAECYSLKVIKPVGKGSAHKELTGLYTSTGEAEKAVDRFLAEKEKPRGKAVKSS